MKSSYKIPQKTFKTPSFTIRPSHIIAVICLILCAWSCSQKKALKNDILTFNEYLSDTIEFYETKNGKLAASRKALEGSKESLEMLLAARGDSLSDLRELVGYYKRVAAAGAVNQKTKVEIVEVPINIPGEIGYFDTPFTYKDPWYTLSGRSTNLGLKDVSFELENTLSFVLGDKKSGFWSTELRFDAVNSNPNITTSGVDSYVHSEKTKRFGLGIVFGYGGYINDKIVNFDYFLGLGGSFDFVRF